VSHSAGERGGVEGEGAQHLLHALTIGKIDRMSGGTNQERNDENDEAHKQKRAREYAPIMQKGSQKFEDYSSSARFDSVDSFESVDSVDVESASDALNSR
jgi:hypothetical protein